MTASQNTPLLSVIMPVYNGMATLERAVRSVQGQSFADWELLVVDDCSTDGSREAVATWAEADPRIRPLRCTENRGPGAARNLGLRSARGQFIAYLDCDDEYDPQYLEHVARLRDKGDVLVFGYDFVYEDGSSPHPDPLPAGEGTLGRGPHPDPLPAGEGTLGRGPHPNPLPKGEGTLRRGPHPNPLPNGEGTARTTTWQPAAHRHRLFATNIVVPLGIAHSREWIDKLDGFNELVSPDEDWDFVRRLARAGARFAFFPLKSGRYYIRSTSRSRKPRLLPWQRETLQRNWRANKPIYEDPAAKINLKAVQKIAFASPHCLIDCTSGAAGCKIPAPGATKEMTPGGGSLERAIVDWNALIDEYGPVVVRISWRILGNGADVEDNVQEVFFEAFRFHNRETVRHWGGLLRRLATIGALAKLRRRRHELSLEVVGQPACESRPEEGPIARELEARLRRAVAALPEREGAVFSLRCFEGLELPKIAATLGIKYSAAATALSRARAKLEAVFAETAVEEA